MLTRIEIDSETNDVSFFFDDEDDPWALAEFERDSNTRRRLGQIVSGINWFNSMKERDEQP